MHQYNHYLSAAMVCHLTSILDYAMDGRSYNLPRRSQLIAVTIERTAEDLRTGVNKILILAESTNSAISNASARAELLHLKGTAQ